jgi:hypothetical protein
MWMGVRMPLIVLMTIGRPQPQLLDVQRMAALLSVEEVVDRWPSFRSHSTLVERGDGIGRAPGQLDWPP